MFLSDLQIKERMLRGDLRIDPAPDAEALLACSVELHLGDYFSQPLKAGPRGELLFDQDAAKTQQVKIGDEVALKAKSRLLVTTLEIVTMPADLLGLITVRSSWERMGISGSTSLVHPGFNGRLVCAIDNHAEWDIPLKAGSRAMHLTFAQIGQTARTSSQVVHHLNVGNTLNLSQSAAGSVKSKPNSSAALQDTDWKNLVATALATTGPEKGKALESLSAELFRSIAGVSIVKMNVNLKAEELDILLRNEGPSGFWRIAGPQMIVECKNWSDKVGAREISVIDDKLRTMGPDAKTCFLIAPNGITGEYYRDAMLKVREKRTQGKYVILIDKKDLELIANGTPFADVVDRRYNELLMI